MATSCSRPSGLPLAVWKKVKRIGACWLEETDMSTNSVLEIAGDENLCSTVCHSSIDQRSPNEVGATIRSTVPAFTERACRFGCQTSKRLQALRARYRSTTSGIK